MAGIIDLNQIVRDGQLFAEHGYEPHIKAYIPTQWVSNHASNLIELKNGDLLCCWFAGLSEGSADIKIALSRLDAGTNRWAEPQLVSDDYTRSEQNPSLFETPSGELWLLYTAQLSRGTMRVEEWYEKVRRGEEKGHFSMQETAQIRRRISRDGGRTWGEAEVLFDKPGSFCRHPILPLSNGEWIFPMWYSLGEEDANKPQYGRDYSAVQISSDQGATWHEYPVPGSVRRVHMSIVETAPGRLSRFSAAARPTASTNPFRWTMAARGHSRAPLACPTTTPPSRRKSWRAGASRWCSTTIARATIPPPCAGPAAARP